MKTIGKVIEEEILSKGMTMYHLSRKSGVSNWYISQIIAGAKNPTVKKLSSIAHALGMKTSRLLSKTGD